MINDEIDYLALLKKYMAYIIQTEGGDCLGNERYGYRWRRDVVMFTTKELDILRAISSDLG